MNQINYVYDVTLITNISTRKSSHDIRSWCRTSLITTDKLEVQLRKGSEAVKKISLMKNYVVKKVALLRKQPF